MNKNRMNSDIFCKYIFFNQHFLSAKVEQSRRSCIRHNLFGFSCLRIHSRANMPCIFLLASFLLLMTDIIEVMDEPLLIFNRSMMIICSQSRSFCSLLLSIHSTIVLIL